MSHAITVELSDGAFAALEEEAKAESRSPTSLAADALERRFSSANGTTLTDAEKDAARKRFERHFGAVSFGEPTGADNESIDADLAREYGRGLEQR